MKNIKKFLGEIQEFNDFIEKRAFEYIRANQFNYYGGVQYDFYIKKIEHGLDCVSFEFEENTRHDCPDGGEIELTIEQLEMNDADWNRFIDNISNEILKKQEANTRKYKEDERQEKIKLFNKLKDELGDNI